MVCLGNWYSREPFLLLLHHVLPSMNKGKKTTIFFLPEADVSGSNHNSRNKMKHANALQSSCHMILQCHERVWNIYRHT